MHNDIDIVLAYPLPTADSPVQLVPLSILYPGAYFKAQGLRVEYFDQRFDPPEMLDDLIRRSKEIAVSAMTGYQCGKAAEILMRAKSINPDIVTGVGGHHARILPDEVLSEPFVDTIYERIDYGMDLFPLDDQTLPYFRRGEMQYITSIGCPYGCRFCAVSMPFQPRPMQRIDNELSQLHEATGFTEVSFADPNIAHFAYTAESGKNIRFDAVTRMRALGAVMRKLDASWECNMRCPDLTPDMVDAMAHGKCTHMELGCESGSERVLRDIVRKGHGVEAIRQAVKSVKGSGISTMYSFLAFMPGETMQDIIETMDLIDWIVDADPLARVSIYQFTPYPGTPLYQDAVSGKHGYPPFSPPKTMMEWGRMRLMASPIYWIAGLNFRLDNSRKNFPGDDWRLIEPYIKQAQIQWRNREILDFPVEEVEQLISAQLAKRQKNRCV